MTRVTVVGAGVVGLSAALRLADAGHAVAVVADALTPDTTSDRAAAIWFPYLAEPADRVTGWGAATFRTLAALAGDAGADTGCGVRMQRGREYSRRPLADPPWRDTVDGFARVDAVPAPYADGRTYTVPVVDTSRYLPWLLDRVHAAGVTVQRGRVDHLAAAPGDAVVNCAGLGARDLVPDPALRPVRGQVVRVAATGLTEWALDDDDPVAPTYVVPRTADIVLGGTAQPDSWDTDPDPATADAILRRCTALVPALQDAEVIGHHVGLRPGRPTVRLDRDRLPDGRPVVHCYGHGGAGITLSWGCADEVVALLADA